MYIQVTVDKAMQAILVMRGFIIERVIIKAIGEGAADASNKVMMDFDWLLRYTIG